MHTISNSTTLSFPSLTMVSLDNVEPTSPRISFSADFLVDRKTTQNSEIPKPSHDMRRCKSPKIEFEFLSSSIATNNMLTAEELFFEGKLLPFAQMEHLEKLNKITLKAREEKVMMEKKEENKEESRGNWFMDEDPSPRPPSCTVLWKELLKLRKHRASSLSPSPSASSSSSTSTVDMESIDEGKEGMWNKEQHVKRIKKGLERTRSASFRIRPVVNVPVCAQGKHTAFPPLFSFKKGNV